MYHSGTTECTKWGLNGDVSGRYYLVRPRHVVLFRPQNSVCLWGCRPLGVLLRCSETQVQWNSAAVKKKVVSVVGSAIKLVVDEHVILAIDVYLPCFEDIIEYLAIYVVIYMNV